MRLTLRTMLAYLDGVLKGRDHADIGWKIEKSPFAGDLAARIAALPFRRKLAAPPLPGIQLEQTASGPELEFVDPNEIAEYLDNCLPAYEVEDVEKACLKSDVYLSEVATVHHLMVTLLGRPIKVRRSTRRLLYDLPGRVDELLSHPAAPGAVCHPADARLSVSQRPDSDSADEDDMLTFIPDEAISVRHATAGAAKASFASDDDDDSLGLAALYDDNETEATVKARRMHAGANEPDDDEEDDALSLAGFGLFGAEPAARSTQTASPRTVGAGSGSNSWSDSPSPPRGRSSDGDFAIKDLDDDYELAGDDNGEGNDSPARSGPQARQGGSRPNSLGSLPEIDLFQEEAEEDRLTSPAAKQRPQQGAGDDDIQDWLAVDAAKSAPDNDDDADDDFAGPRFTAASRGNATFDIDDIFDDDGSGDDSEVEDENSAAAPPAKAAAAQPPADSFAASAMQSRLDQFQKGDKEKAPASKPEPVATTAPEGPSRYRTLMESRGVMITAAVLLFVTLGVGVYYLFSGNSPAPLETLAHVYGLPEDAAEPAVELKGVIEFQVGKGKIPDSGALVVAWPANDPSKKAFESTHVFADANAPTQALVQTKLYTARTNSKGQFRLRMHEASQFEVAVVSFSATRPGDIQEADLKSLGKRIKDPDKLIGRKSYLVTKVDVAPGAAVELNHEFESKVNPKRAAAKPAAEKSTEKTTAEKTATEKTAVEKNAAAKVGMK